MSVWSFLRNLYPLVDVTLFRHEHRARRYVPELAQDSWKLGPKRGRGARITYFDWGLNPEAEAWQRAQVLSFLDESDYARTLATQIEQGTSTDFFDWIDHMVIPGERVDTSALSKMSFFEKRPCRRTRGKGIRSKAPLFSLS